MNLKLAVKILLHSKIGGKILGNWRDNWRDQNTHEKLAASTCCNGADGQKYQSSVGAKHDIPF